MCIGATGSVSGVLFPQYGTNREHKQLVTGLVSGAGPDGSFAVGSDGVSQADPHKPIYIQETYAPPDALPAGIPGDQSGKLLKARSVRRAEHRRRHHGVRDGERPRRSRLRQRPVRGARASSRRARRGRRRQRHPAGRPPRQREPVPPVPERRERHHHGHARSGRMPTSCRRRSRSVRTGTSSSAVSSARSPAPVRSSSSTAGPVRSKQTWDGFTTVTGVAVGRTARCT